MKKIIINGTSYWLAEPWTLGDYRRFDSAAGKAESNADRAAAMLLGGLKKEDGTQWAPEEIDGIPLTDLGELHTEVRGSWGLGGDDEDAPLAD